MNSVEVWRIKRRDIYIWSQSEKQRFQLHGIEFHEWISCMGDPLNLLLLESQFSDAHYHSGSNLEYILKTELSSLFQDDIYGYGDFVWVDFENEVSLDSLSPMNIAELLYMRHTGEPLHTPFLPAINNRFVYYAHDDGWSTRLYCNNPHDFDEILRRLIPMKLNIDAPIGDDCLDVLIPLCSHGLFFDMQHIDLSPTVTVPFYVVGEFNDMDAINVPDGAAKGILEMNERWNITFL